MPWQVPAAATLPKQSAHPTRDLANERRAQSSAQVQSVAQDAARLGQTGSQVSTQGLLQAQANQRQAMDAAAALGGQIKGVQNLQSAAPAMARMAQMQAAQQAAAQQAAGGGSALAMRQGAQAAQQPFLAASQAAGAQAAQDQAARNALEAQMRGQQAGIYGQQLGLGVQAAQLGAGTAAQGLGIGSRMADEQAGRDFRQLELAQGRELGFDRLKAQGEMAWQNYLQGLHGVSDTRQAGALGAYSGAAGIAATQPWGQIGQGTGTAAAGGGGGGGAGANPYGNYGGVPANPYG